MKKKLKNKKGINSDYEDSLKHDTNLIQNKLSLLKEEIEKRKTSKRQKSNQIQKKVESFLKTNQFDNFSRKGNQDQLFMLMSKINAEQYTENIRRKGIAHLDDLFKTSHEIIDEWKDIPVGFRIKIKKLVNEHLISKKEENQYSEIQTIMKERKAHIKFVPITNKEQDLNFQAEEHLQNPFQSDSDEDVLIQSLNKIFYPRKGIIKNNSNHSIKNNTNLKAVHWDQSVEQYNKQTSHFFTELSQTFHPNRSKSRDKQKKVKNQYCWNCLKKVREERIESEGRCFCNSNCQNFYQKKLINKNSQSEKEETELEEIDLSLF